MRRVYFIFLEIFMNLLVIAAGRNQPQMLQHAPNTLRGFHRVAQLFNGPFSFTHEEMIPNGTRDGKLNPMRVPVEYQSLFHLCFYFFASVLFSGADDLDDQR